MAKKTDSPVDIAPFLRELQQLRNAERAIADQHYHKSSREHWGVSVPECDKLTRTLSKGFANSELLLIAKVLWETDLFDLMVCAAKILTLPRLSPSPALWNMILHFLKRVDGWALEDHLAHAAWKCVLANECLLDEIEEWTNHSNFWMRRAALVYTLPFAKPGHNPEKMLRWASGYARDPEWFIQKAIGWWLRVLGKHNPERVSIFLSSHWKELKSVARKEATRKLSAEWQERILQFQAAKQSITEHKSGR